MLQSMMSPLFKVSNCRVTDTVMISLLSALADDKLHIFELKYCNCYKLSVCSFISRNITSQWTQIK